MKAAKIIYTSAVVLLSLVMSAADLTFDLKINRGAEVDCNPQVKKQTIAIFVIDCSGSMMGKYIDPSTGNPFRGWSRVDLICKKMLPERFEALPEGTQVYTYLYSLYNENAPWMTPNKAVLSTPGIKADFLRKLQQDIIAKVKMSGATPYFDTMHQVLSSIEKTGWLNNPHVNLMLFDYTDGLNATDYCTWLRYPANHRAANYSDQLAASKKRFNNRWGAFLQRIAKQGFYEQLNLGTAKENPGVKHIPAYKVAFNGDKSGLKSPQDVRSQKVPLFASFPVNQESWDILTRKDQCAVRIQFGRGPVRQYPVSLRKTVNSIQVPVPADAMSKATLVTVFFVCPAGEKGKFTLAAPKPVSFYLPGPRPTIENVLIQGMPLDGKTVLTVLKGKDVYLTADGSAKNYRWKFSDGKVLTGEAVTRKFDRIGRYTFTVSSEGNENSKKTGIIEVVSIDIMIAPQSGKITEPRKEASFTAVVQSGNLKPSSCSWYVTGPIDPKTKANPAVTRLVTGADPLRNRYTFAKPGEYQISVTAKYDRLPLETREASTPWSVYETAAIRFTKNTPADGQGFDFGKQITLGIDNAAGKIDPKSIVWKANGKEIRKATTSIAYTHPVGQGQISVVFTVEAKDSVLKKPVDRLKRTYTFGCSHADPIVKAVRKDGSTAWGVGEEVDFRITPADQYKDISWVFGDDKSAVPVKVTNGQNYIHRAVKAGKFTSVMTCRCRKCGTEFRKELKTETQHKEPESRIKLKPEKTSYRNGEGVRLCDDGKGDYFQCRLLKWNPEKRKFEEYKILKRGFELQINLGKGDFKTGHDEGLIKKWTSRADFVFKIEALEEDGTPALDKEKKPVESPLCTIRVRPHLLYSLVILGVAAVVFIIILYLLSKVLLGNGPRAWSVYSYSDEIKPEQKDFQDQLNLALSSGLPLELKDTDWHWQDHRAVIPLDQLVTSSGGDDFPQKELYVIPNGADGPLIFGPVPAYPLMSCEDEVTYGAVFKLQPSRSQGQTTYLRLVLKTDQTDRCWDRLFWGLVILVFLGLAVGAMWLFVF